MLDGFSAHRHDDDSMTLTPARTAVLVVDMLNDFCCEGGAMVLLGIVLWVNHELRVVPMHRGF